MFSYTGHSRLVAGRLFLLLVLMFVIMLPMAALSDGNGEPPIQNPESGDATNPTPDDSTLSSDQAVAILLLELVQLALP